MNQKKVIVTLLLAAILISACVTGVSARYATPEGVNAGLHPNEYIYIGESNLNFSAFAVPGKTITGLVGLDGDTQIDMIPITSNKILSVPSGSRTSAYYAEYDSSETNKSMFCWVRPFNPGSIAVVAADDPNDSPIIGSDISKDLGVIFYMSDQAIESSQLTDWFEYEIKMPTGRLSSSVTNLAGTQVTLGYSSAHTNPSEKYRDFAFRFSNQSFLPTIDPGKTLPGVTLSFKIKNLPGLNGREVSRPIILISTRLNLDIDTSYLNSDRWVIVTLTGTPNTIYPLNLLPAGNNRPYFVNDGKMTVTNNQSIRVTTDSTGKYVVYVQVPDNVITGLYTVTTDYRVSKTFTVAKAPFIKLTFAEPPADAISGKFAVGDQIYLRGQVSGTDSCPVYFYTNGLNLPVNGASLENPGIEVVNNGPPTFTTAHYSSMIGRWDWYWQTRGFEPGSYTIHANLKPIGHKESGKPGGSGADTDGNVVVSWDYTISERSILVKSSDKSNGYFAKGDILYSWWTARGSPGYDPGNGNSGGEVRWYTFGTNFRYADREVNYPLYGSGSSSGSSSSDNSDIGKTAPWGEYGFSYPRTLTYGLSPGTYYLVYQHPGANNVFDITADDAALNSGALTTISTTYGSSAGFEHLQGRAAA